MSGEDSRGRMTLPEAAGVLHLPMESVVALVGAGYLRTTSSDDGPRFALGDLKAFLARNADGEPVVDLADVSLDSLDPQDLLDALDGRSEDMARRALDLLIAVFPEAGRWPLGQQARFIEEARSRFEAILAVASLGDETDAELLEELVAGNDPVAVFHQVAQQLELTTRQPDLRTVHPHGNGVEIGNQMVSGIGNRRRFAVTRRAAAQHGPNACHQLAKRERFRNVVVGAKLEAGDPVALAGAGSEHDDRDV